MGLLILSPLFLVMAALIKLDSRGPVFFRQVRMGAQDRTFRVFKFRTMVVDAESRKAEIAHLNMHSAEDPRTFKVPDDPRVTRPGRFLRRWRIDELPQLLNVLAGHMPFEEMTKLDYLYVTNWSLREDLRLILLTVPALTRARAAY
jgi:lipopolysaccharide/colanic/teichoic acid biosynthesis glycosyltransferase